MLYQLMRYCRNYFPASHGNISGIVKIEGGAIDLLHLLPGQYYIIEGSVLNDGLHREGDALTDETFEGDVTPLAIPKAFQELAERIEEWSAKGGEPSAYVSESFDGYSYSRATGSDGGQLTWQDAFRKEISVWRKV